MWGTWDVFKQLNYHRVASFTRPDRSLLEEDVQWVFVSGMQIRDGKLFVKNENGKTYTPDLSKGRVEGEIRYWLPLFLIVVFLVVVALFAWMRRRNGQQSAAI